VLVRHYAKLGRLVNPEPGRSWGTKRLETGG